MNTTTTQTRRRGISSYQNILDDINARKEREENARNNAEKKALLDAEEERRLKLDAEMNEAQKIINTLCESTQQNYNAMINCCKNMRINQNEIAEKEKEEDLFHQTKSEIYRTKDIDNSLNSKMKTRRVAYYALPILDCFFAYFAIYPIVTSKLADLDSAISGFAVLIGAVLSIFVGYGVSIISRLGVSSLENDNTSDSMRALKKMAIACSVLALPMMYIIGEVAFNGGTQWSYSGGFAFMSLLIQLLIVSGYKQQIEAVEYFRAQKENEEVGRIKESDENAIRYELQSLKDKNKQIIVAFNTEYTYFTESFRNLAIARDEFIRRFGQDAKYYLNQMVIYIGDLICFRYERIPLQYDNNGHVAAIALVDFPYVDGGRDMFYNNEFVYLSYMMQYAGTEISLTETMQKIEAERKNRLGAPVPNSLGVPTGSEPEETSGTDPINEGTTQNSTQVDETDDDSEDSTGVIW